jgi:hypothetical protein
MSLQIISESKVRRIALRIAEDVVGEQIGWRIPIRAGQCGPNVPIVGGAPAGASVNISSVNTTIYEVDFTRQASQNFANGAIVIDSLSYTGANIGAATRTIFDILQGTGLRWTAPTSGAANNFIQGTETAANLQIPLSSIPGFSTYYDLQVEIYFTASTFENNGDSFQVSLRQPSASPDAGSSTADRVAGARFGRTLAGANRASFVNLTTLTGSTTDYTGSNTVGIRMSAGHPNWWTMVGTYGTTWGISSPAIGFTQTAGANQFNPYLMATTNLCLSFQNGASDASPTSLITLARMRVIRA